MSREPESRPAPAPAEAKGDGRHRRSQRSRERILDAVEEALKNPDLVLTAERVAAEAGVSLSTLFRHFGDLDGMSEAMRARVVAQVAPIMSRGPFVGELLPRLRDLIDRRNQAFERTAPIRLAARRAPKGGEALRKREAETEAALENQLRDALGPELETIGSERIAAVRALLSPEGWDQLHYGQGAGTAEVARIWEVAVGALLAPEAD